MDAVMTTACCVIFGPIFTLVGYSIVNGQAYTKPYKTVRQTGEN